MIPDEIVSTERPPGMNLAVISNKPPRRRICCARPVESRLPFRPLRGAALEEAAEARSDQVGGVVAEERTGRTGRDHEQQRLSPCPAATPPMITIVSPGTIGMTESRKAMAKMISRNHQFAEKSASQLVSSVNRVGGVGEDACDERGEHLSTLRHASHDLCNVSGSGPARPMDADRGSRCACR